jgi:hypothetical protein
MEVDCPIDVARNMVPYSAMWKRPRRRSKRSGAACCTLFGQGLPCLCSAVGWSLIGSAAHTLPYSCHRVLSWRLCPSLSFWKSGREPIYGLPFFVEQERAGI